MVIKLLDFALEWWPVVAPLTFAAGGLMALGALEFGRIRRGDA